MPSNRNITGRNHPINWTVTQSTATGGWSLTATNSLAGTITTSAPAATTAIDVETNGDLRVGDHVPAPTPEADIRLVPDRPNPTYLDALGMARNPARAPLHPLRREGGSPPVSDPRETIRRTLNSQHNALNTLAANILNEISDFSIVCRRRHISPNIVARYLSAHQELIGDIQTQMEYNRNSINDLEFMPDASLSAVARQTQDYERFISGARVREGRLPELHAPASAPSVVLSPEQLELTGPQNNYLSAIEQRTERFPGRQFGVEIEFVGITRHEARDLLESTGYSAEVEEYNHQRRNHWKLTTDSSIRVPRGLAPDQCGELVSPILRGLDGLRTVMRICRILSQAGATVNTSCGLHVHVNATDLVSQDISQILMRYAANQEFVDWFMPRGRRNNRFCLPLGAAIQDSESWIRQLWREEAPISEIARRWNRYSAVNLASYARHGTVEFRQHHGSVDPEVVANWIQFCVMFVETSRYNPDTNPLLLAAGNIPTPLVVVPPSAPRRSAPLVVNGIRLNRRVRYDRRRFLFYKLIEAARRGELCRETDLAHSLRISTQQLRTMIRELNEIAMGANPEIRIGGNCYHTRVAGGFYINTIEEGNRMQRRIYVLSHLLDIVNGNWDEISASSSVRSFANIGSPVGYSHDTLFFRQGTVGSLNFETYQSLLRYLGGLIPATHLWTFLSRTFERDLGPSAARTMNSAVSGWQTDWVTRYVAENRRFPRVPPANTDGLPPPPSIPRNRRTEWAQHPMPGISSFVGLDKLFQRLPSTLRAAFIARATRYHAPWLAGGIPSDTSPQTSQDNSIRPD